MSGKRLIRETTFRESDRPGNVCKPIITNTQIVLKLSAQTNNGYAMTLDKVIKLYRTKKLKEYIILEH